MQPYYPLLSLEIGNCYRLLPLATRNRSSLGLSNLSPPCPPTILVSQPFWMPGLRHWKVTSQYRRVSKRCSYRSRNCAVRTRYRETLFGGHPMLQMLREWDSLHQLRHCPHHHHWHPLLGRCHPVPVACRFEIERESSPGGAAPLWPPCS